MEQVVVGAVPASGMDAALPMPVLPPVPMDVAEPQQQQAETVSDKRHWHAFPSHVAWPWC